jgi:NAD(P)-dependent dehydrogenase (short-subunit alcohol dehydrogenase family)
LAAAGANMILADNNMEGLKKIEAEIIEEGNLADSYEINMLELNSLKTFVDKVIEKHKKIDVLINCAGINKRMGCLDADEETFDRIIGVNLKGAYFLSQEVAKHMVKEHNGSIINVAS